MSQDLVSARRSHRTGIPFPDAPQPGDLDVLQGSASSGSALTPEDMHALSELRDDLIVICEKAKKRRVKVIMDAEYRFANSVLLRHLD
jgi:proline dehydrogenase